jgi:hypothetical protein
MESTIGNTSINSAWVGIPIRIFDLGEEELDA